MQTIIPTTNSTSRSHGRTETSESLGLFRKPHYDCEELADALKLTVFVPGVEAGGLEITSRGPDLKITARKSHFVRVNFKALHLEKSQHDYQLRLRLGHGLDYASLLAELGDGVLTLTLPKKQLASARVITSIPALTVA